MPDFNRTVTKNKRINETVNNLIDDFLRKRSAVENGTRGYLGASAVGNECLRKSQYDWLNPNPPEPRSQRIFDRGHWFEDYIASLFIQSGFQLIRGGPRTKFSQMDGLFCGHADGIIVHSPTPMLITDCLWEHKALGAAGWRKLEKHGLKDAYPGYYAQVQLYMAYLGLHKKPCLFTATNCDTCEILNITVPFDAVKAQEVSDKAVSIIQEAQANGLMPRVTDDRDFYLCRFCSHSEICWGIEP